MLKSTLISSVCLHGIRAVIGSFLLYFFYISSSISALFNQVTTPTETVCVTRSSSAVIVVSPDNNNFLHPSNLPGMNLINITFDRHGYSGWRRSILITLSAKHKLGFINGSCAPPTSDSPNFHFWTRCNDMIISWLLNSLSKNL